MILFRNATSDDLPALDLVRNTPDLHRENFQRTDNIHRRFLVCEMNGKIVGFSQLLLRNAPSEDQQRSMPKISDLYIAPAYRSQGIGTRFIAEMESIIRREGFQQMHLGVDAENPRALALYKRLGYIQLQEKPYPRRAVFHEESGRQVERLYWRIDMTKDI